MRWAFDEVWDTFDTMMENWQTPVALLVVLAAAVYLVRVAFAKRRKPGCGSGGEGCGIPADRFKAKLKRR